MGAPSFIHTREEQHRLLTPHEYTIELSIRHLQDCVSCGHRTEFTCIKCSYCYSCHWKKEQFEEIELRDKLEDFYLSSSKGKQEPKQETKDKTKEFGKWGTLDVLGQPAEPICNFYGCHHKFSLHGSRKCRCRHPTNKTLGVFIKYL
jgi:hypothetical protein